MCNLPNFQAQDLKELSQKKKKHAKSVVFVVPSQELLVDAWGNFKKAP
jgi:hypothetical protein